MQTGSQIYVTIVTCCPLSVGLCVNTLKKTIHSPFLSYWFEKSAQNVIAMHARKGHYTLCTRRKTTKILNDLILTSFTVNSLPVCCCLSWRLSCKKGVDYITFWDDFHFLQDPVNLWQTDLFWHEKIIPYCFWWFALCFREITHAKN